MGAFGRSECEKVNAEIRADLSTCTRKKQGSFVNNSISSHDGLHRKQRWQWLILEKRSTNRTEPVVVVVVVLVVVVLFLT